MTDQAAAGALPPTHFWGSGGPSIDYALLPVREAHMLLTANAASGNLKGIRDFPVAREWINQYNAHGHTPLTACLDRAGPGAPWTVSLLLEMGCNPNLPAHSGRLPLEMAAQMEHRRAGLLCARRLVKGGAVAAGLNDQDQTALFFVSRPLVAAGKARSLVKFLIASGCNPNQRDVYNETALSSAVLSGRMDVIEALLENGAIPDDDAGLYATPMIEKLLRSSRDMHHLEAQVANPPPTPRKRC